MNYTKKTAAAEAFLTGRGIPDEDVLSLDISGDGVRMHLYGQPLTGVTWEHYQSQATGAFHYSATVIQDDVEILIAIVTTAEVAA